MNVKDVPKRMLLINHSCGIGSTGKICIQIADEYTSKGTEVRIAYGRNSYIPEQYKKYAVRIGTSFDVRLHGLRTRLLDEHGYGSQNATRKFLKWADKYNPDVLWLHCIHGYYINFEFLFKWIKHRPNMLVKWTMHDCWAFTGHCAYFTMAKCEQWKKHCLKCCQKNCYPKSILKDNCFKNYDRKKAAFKDVNNLTIITPSQWLAELVKQSYLKEYPIEVVYNTIDRAVFKPTQSDFREKYHIQNKRIILGIANVWEERKGLSDFIVLSKMLNSTYVIVLVGLDDKQSKKLPSNIIGIEKTTDQKELAGIYTAADIVLNPSREETFGMTVIEAKACGTEVIVLEGTACEEIAKKYGGIIVPAGDINALYEAIVNFHYG